MKKLLAGLSLVLVLGLAVGGTLALFNAQTSEISNTFTAGAGVSLDIKEPTWDGKVFDGDTAITTELGVDVAKKFAPGEAIPKDPTLMNTSDEVSVYAAMTIDYGNGITSYADLEKFATIDFNTTDWEFNGTKTVAYYKHELAKGIKTSPVFTNVKINDDAVKDEKSEKNIKDFDIKVKGYAVQVADQADYKAAINAQFGI